MTSVKSPTLDILEELESHHHIVSLHRQVQIAEYFQQKAMYVCVIAYKKSQSPEWTFCGHTPTPSSYPIQVQILQHTGAVHFFVLKMKIQNNHFQPKEWLRHVLPNLKDFQWTVEPL